MKRVITTLAVLLATALAAEAQEVKNIIYLIGDGMGLTSASMMQLENNYEPRQTIPCLASSPTAPS